MAKYREEVEQVIETLAAKIAKKEESLESTIDRREAEINELHKELKALKEYAKTLSYKQPDLTGVEADNIA